jgi:transcriptional regulator with XRE-family HTH domain
VTDRRQLLDTFRQRLDEVIDRSGTSRTRFAELAGIDRSSLSQLLSPSNRRLPRAETLAELATAHQVSIDWLLGLSHAGPMQAEMLAEQASFEPHTLAPNDERLIAWFDEARGFKIRYVPSTLPDLLKTTPVIRHELDAYVASSPEQKIETAAVRLAWTRDLASDLECCSSRQSVESLARGEGIWRDLPHAARVEQIEQMIELTRELYPKFRWFLFDGLQRWAGPVTIFGPQRAALYLGQMYLVLTSAEHVRTMTNHFDDLIKGAIVHAHEMPAHLEELLVVAKRSRR